MGVLANRAKMTVASAPGTGTITLGIAVVGFQTFAAGGISDQQVVSYVIEDGTAWEIGQGVYSATGPTLARGVIASSGGGAAISASANALVFLSPLVSDINGYAPAVKITGNANASANVGVPYRFPATNAAAFTLTLPVPASIAPGWCTEEVVNENWTYALNIAVPSGAILDGTTNGALTVLPQQKVRFRYDSDGYHTIWVDRSPLVLAAKMNAITQLVWQVPIGFGSFDMRLSEIATSVSGSNFAGLLSTDGGSTFLTSGYVNDYCGQSAPSSASIGTNTTSTNYLQIIPGTSTSPSGSGIVNISGKLAYMKCLADAYGGSADTQYMMRCVNSPNASQVTAIKFFSAGGGTMSGNISIRALPAS